MQVIIPPVRETDAEDVVWGLQTAEALWKRGERVDAVVWLRRAAQAAGDAADDDRALELARSAAELSDWMARDADGIFSTPNFSDRGEGSARTDLASLEPAASFGEEAKTSEGELAPEASSLAPTPSVPPAAALHAGIYNPWDEPSSPPRSVRAKTPPSAPRTPVASPNDDDDEVVTSVTASVPSIRGINLSKTSPEGRAASPAELPKPAPPVPKAGPARTPPPLPPRAKAPPPLPSQKSSPPAVAESPAVAAPAPPEPVVHNTVQAPPPVLALDDVEAFADLPDDAREAFAAAATVDQLSEGEEVSGFALAYVLAGSFDVAATMVDAPAVRLEAGAVLRARGTTNEGVPMRMISVSKASTLATWTDAAVDDAFRAIPWVEEDLRALADRVQTLVGITIGPLGERIDVSIREDIVSKLTMRTLLAGDVVVEAGAPVPGLLLVGVGELELVKDGEVVGAVGSGDFLFAGEVLGAGAAPATARAGAGGALILFGDRMVAQELLVTWPPLLEVFAGM